MPSIRYLGPTSEDIDVLSRIRLQEEVSGELTPTMVDQHITEHLDAMANTYYLGNKSSQYVTPSALSNKGAELIKTNEAGKPGGPVPIYNGRISDLSLLPNPSKRPGGRGWNKAGEWNGGNLTLTTGYHYSTSEQQIGSFTVNGPNYPWFALFLGFIVMGGGKGELTIKRGSTPVSRAVSGGDVNAWFTCDFAPQVLTPYTGSQSFTITRRAFFDQVNVSGFFEFACISVPA